MVSEGLIRSGAQTIAEAAGSPARVILFGSRARGDAAHDSDVDLLVVMREVADRFGESARLARLAGDLHLPADVVVVSEAQAEEWGAVRGTMLHDALTEGKLLAEA